jgi:hypothetical protein
VRTKNDSIPMIAHLIMISFICSLFFHQVVKREIVFPLRDACVQLLR